jgi:hypothetical protein
MGGAETFDWGWAVAVIGGPVLLGLAIFFGTVSWRKRNRSPELEAARDRAIHQNYGRDR